MSEAEFEEQLIELISKAQDSGLTDDTIVGAMELRIMALEEEAED
ncbi:hypothetical protein [Methylobacterium iners]|uniref:Uncharacterized protein n=1 Tax=Methylobacterium iners TaxID=418707 RepID=A0ABQ4RRH8_9HYPH|nr:hypothetical protein [Methylobacterium iners]GJD93381.1 hypothetical protein OCOJLMKI_0575 [Methylobacterium iners]